VVNKVGVAGQERVRRTQGRLVLLAVHPQVRARTRAVGRFLAAWVLLLGLGLVAVSRTAAVAREAYQEDRLSAQVQALAAQARSLRAQVLALEAAPRLMAVARQAGMVLPSTVAPLRTLGPAPSPSSPRGAAAGGGGGVRRLVRDLLRLLQRLP
jgi:hypothetical protein